jgi:hypothetical protein
VAQRFSAAIKPPTSTTCHSDRSQGAFNLVIPSAPEAGEEPAVPAFKMNRVERTLLSDAFDLDLAFRPRTKATRSKAGTTVEEQRFSAS